MTPPFKDVSFLGGLNLGTPAERNQHTLTRDLKTRRDRAVAQGEFRAADGYVYRGGADLVLKHGEYFVGRFLPEEFEPYRGEEGYCFQNALALAEATGLPYYEGYYNTAGAGVAVNHAWCVAEGGVVDPTFGVTAETLAIAIDAHTRLPFLPPEHWCYYGVRFDTAFVRAHTDWAQATFQTVSCPMLDRPLAEVREHLGDPDEMIVPHDYPVLKVRYDPNRSSLP